MLRCPGWHDSPLSTAVMGCIGSNLARPTGGAVSEGPRGSGITVSAVRELTESYVPVDPVLLHAMAWGTELGVEPVRPGAGAVLRVLAAALSAKSAVEVGTGTGASGLWILP